MEKTTITLTHDELRRLAWFMDHYTDYLAGDDRIDHGWNLLKQVREYPSEWKIEVYKLAGKLKRRARNLKQNTHSKPKIPKSKKGWGRSYSTPTIPEENK